MTDYVTFAVFGAVYDDLDAAELDYEAVRSLYVDWQLIDNFDAAVVERRGEGTVEIVKKHELSTRKMGWRGAGLGLAIGAVIALFPAAAIGGGLLAATAGGGAAMGAIAGHVSKGMKPADLEDLGEHLDAGEYGLIVVAAADVSAKVEQAIANANVILEKHLRADDNELDADVGEASSGGRPRPGSPTSNGER